MECDVKYFYPSIANFTHFYYCISITTRYYQATVGNLAYQDCVHFSLTKHTFLNKIDVDYFL